MINFCLYLLLGLGAGILSGVIGIGGGVVIVPALVFLFGLSQHQAQGMTLALLVPPIGLLAAWTYYSKGYVDLTIAAFVCLGFFLGGFIGAKTKTQEAFYSGQQPLRSRADATYHVGRCCGKGKKPV